MPQLCAHIKNKITPPFGGVFVSRYLCALNVYQTLDAFKNLDAQYECDLKENVGEDEEDSKGNEVCAKGDGEKEEENEEGPDIFEVGGGGAEHRAEIHKDEEHRPALPLQQIYLQEKLCNFREYGMESRECGNCKIV